MSVGKDNKVIVIGLDGATYDLVAKWTKENKLPNLKKLIEKGSFGLLRSVPNLNSAAAWSSFATGLNPGRHGLFFFHEHINQTFKLKFLNATHRQGREVWEFLSEAGKKVGVINVPMTYPCKIVNGFMIAGLDTPSLHSEGFTYPSDLYRQLVKQIGRYTIECDTGKQIKTGDLKGAIRALFETINRQTKTTKFLLENRPWDFFMVVFRIIDTTQHHFWRYLAPEHYLVDQRLAQRYRDTIYEIYESTDLAIGELLKVLPEDTNIIIMSDHGSAPSEFGPRFLNHFLEMTGYLSPVLKDNAGGLFRIKHQAKIFLNRLIDMGDTYVGGRLRKFLKLHFFKVISNMASEKYYPVIAWEKSLAYSPHARPEIWLNLKGREPMGVVSEKDYNKVCDEIIIRLNEWRDPETGNKVIRNAVRRNDVYHGPYVEKSADIIVQFNDALVTGIDLPEHYVIKKARRRFGPTREYKGFIFGKHADNGIIIASGPDIKSGNIVRDANIMDLMPTILYLEGLEIPQNLDGKVLKDIIKDEFLNRNPIKVSVKEIDEKTSSKRGEYDKMESEIIRQRLTNLGYIE